MMNVIYIAQFHETCGYSHAAHGYLKSLLNIEGVNLKILSVSFDPRRLEKQTYQAKISNEILNTIDSFHFKDQSELDLFLKRDYICIWHMTSVMPVIEKASTPGKYYKNLSCSMEKIILGSTKNYHILAWETDTLSKEYKEIIHNDKTEAVLAPSEWNRETFSKSFKSVLLPHIIEQKEKETEEIKLPQLENKFVVLSVSEWVNRKNFQCLIKSFLMEFSDSDDATLILKTSLPPGQTKQSFLEQFSRIKNNVRTYKNKKQNIIVILDYLSGPKMNYLYDKCDVFCLTSLGEGFSLPTSEAASIGKPVICPRFGGHVDYLDPDNNYFVEGVWDNVFDNPPYDYEGLWYIPTVKSTREKLREAYHDWKRGDLKARGISNHNAVSSGNFSADKVAKIFKKHVFTGTKQRKEKSKIEILKRKIQNCSLEQSLDLLENSFSGEECYILNCGPSLSDHNEEALKNFLKDKLTFTVKQAYEKYREVSDFQFFNCSNLPNRGTFQPHYENSESTILVSSSNYPHYQRWTPVQTSDIFYKIPIRTEINNEFLVRTGEIDKFLIKNNLTRPCGPGIMYETVLFMAIHLGIKDIKVLGWDLTMDKVTEQNYKHFYGSTKGLVNRGDILDWEIEETRRFSKNFYEWCKKNEISLSLVSQQSSLYEGIPRIKLEL